MHFSLFDQASARLFSFTSVLFLFILLGSVQDLRVVGGQRKHCKSVFWNCERLVGCSTAYHNLHLHCSNIYRGSECTEECRGAIIALLSTEDDIGVTLMECDCLNDTFCRERKQYLEVCNTQNLIEALENLTKNNSPITCSLATMMCQADTSCNEALKYYADRCSKMFLGDRCTEKCNNSVSVLFGRQKAKKLLNCTCDGDSSDILQCRRMQTNTRQLCLEPHHRHHHHHNNRTHEHHSHPEEGTLSLQTKSGEGIMLNGRGSVDLPRWTLTWTLVSLTLASLCLR